MLEEYLVRQAAIDRYNWLLTNGFDVWYYIIVRNGRTIYVVRTLSEQAA
jgi:hypothetical protein